MADVRLWHPAHDAYHSAFRMLRIMLVKQSRQVELEKLYLLDFFVAYPFLLHKIHMPRPMKIAFNDLGIQKPETYFVSLPSNLSLFRDMAVIQLEAVKSLVGRGIFKKDKYIEKTAALAQKKIPEKLQKMALQVNEDETRFINFLVNDYGARSVDELRVSTELKRRLV